MTMDMMTLGELISLQRGYDLTETQRRPGSVPIVGSAGVHGYHDTAKVKGPGVTLGRSGASFGKTTFIREDFWPHNTTIFVTDFKGNDPLFISYLLKSLDFSSLNSGSAQQSLNRNFVYPVPVRKFALPMQKRIATILTSYDELIENSQRRIRLMESIMRAIYREWFVQFRFPGHEKFLRVGSSVGDIPKGWEVKPLSQLCSRMESGGTPLRKNAEYWDGGKICWFKTGELWDGFLFESEEKITELGLRESTARLFEPGTLLMAIYGSPTVGRLGIVTRPSSCNQAALGLVADTKQISQTFLYFVLLALRDHFNGMAQGAAQQNISKEKVAGTSALVPPRALVTAFDRVAEPIFSQLQTLQRQIENLCRTRDLLLPRLLSGQVNLEEN
jgi:type I restriction enzyme S subunit